MRKKFIDYLCDPLTAKKLKLLVLKKENEQIVSGILFNNASWYPIINGIPRILINKLKADMLRDHYSFYKRYQKKLPGNIRSDWKKEIAKIANLNKFLAHQKKTAESFAYEWNNIYKEETFEKNNFLHFLSPFVQEKGLNNKKVLDVGCGSGRFTKWASLCGASLAFGTDLGESVDFAYKLTKNMKNVCIVQADIYAMPFKGQFDIAYSIGVLHHLPKPQDGFSKLPVVLKNKGIITIWVYNRRNNKRALYFYEPIRTITRKIPKSILIKLCYLPAAVVHCLNYLTRFFNYLGAKKIAKKIPFAYYTNFSFNMKLNDAFDVLATPKSNYYYFEEIEKWFKRASLKNIKSFEHPEAGITCIGTYSYK